MNQPNWQQHRHPASHANRDCHRDNFIVTELSSPTLRNSLSLSYATGCNISFRERPTFNCSVPLYLFKTLLRVKEKAQWHQILPPPCVHQEQLEPLRVSYLYYFKFVKDSIVNSEEPFRWITCETLQQKQKLPQGHSHVKKNLKMVKMVQSFYVLSPSKGSLLSQCHSVSWLCFRSPRGCWRGFWCY